MNWRNHGGGRRVRSGGAAPALDRQSLARLIVLAVFFLAGIVLGQVLSGRVDDATGTELNRYLTDYISLGAESTPSPRTVWAALLLYLRYPLLAFLLGFASVGVALLPGLTAVFGFFLSFSVCCFTAAFGGDGVLVALALFGFRCLVTLPCYFLLAVPALGTSAALAAVSFGRDRRSGSGVYDRACWFRLCVALGVLLAGVCVELFLSPRLLQLLLGQILS